jgi:hypothetical protein
MHFTDEELLAYADESLPSETCVTIEQSLRDDSSLAQRLKTLLSNRDNEGKSVGDIWRQHRLSCAPRAVLAAYIDNRLGDGLSRHLQFHLESIGCRECSANLEDLRRRAPLTETERRTSKIFQSSAGQLRKNEVED